MNFYTGLGDYCWFDTDPVHSYAKKREKKKMSVTQDGISGAAEKLRHLVWKQTHQHL